MISVTAEEMRRRPAGSWTPVQPFSSLRNQWVLRDRDDDVVDYEHDDEG